MEKAQRMALFSCVCADCSHTPGDQSSGALVAAQKPALSGWWGNAAREAPRLGSQPGGTVPQALYTPAAVHQEKQMTGCPPPPYSQMGPCGRWGWGLVTTEGSDESKSSMLAGKTRTRIQRGGGVGPAPSPLTPSGSTWSSHSLLQTPGVAV